MPGWTRNNRQRNAVEASANAIDETIHQPGPRFAEFFAARSCFEGIGDRTTPATKVEGQILESAMSESRIPDGHDTIDAKRFFGIAQLDEHVGVGDMLASVGDGDRRHVGDKHCGSVDLGEDGRDNIGRARKSACVVVDLKPFLNIGVASQATERENERFSNKMARNPLVAVALP